MLGDLLKTPPSNPEKIIALRESAFANDLFITAVSYFDFFNRIDRSPADIDGVCRLLGVKERPADVMLTLFKAYRLVKERRGRFYLTDLARDYLTRNSAFDLTSYVDSLKNNPVCQQMESVMRTGKPANWAASQTGRDWAAAMQDAAFAGSFTAAMNSRGAYLASGLLKVIDLGGFHRLLDIGGGSGIYAAALVSGHANMSATVFEKPPVDRAAELSINRLRLDRRIAVFTGDMFRDGLPPDHDVHLLSHVLHDWDQDAAKAILRNSFNSLAPGGMIIVHDAHINRNKTGPLSVAEYSVLLMFLSEGKCYSVTEMQDLLEGAGFTGAACRPTVLNRSIITARKPA